MGNVFDLSDAFGPLKVIHVHEPACGLKGILVVDNVARGPSIGGLRMAEDVTLDECARLARAMTFKNAASGLSHGGGKSVLVGDPKMPKDEKERLIRTFAAALRKETDYIFGPDMGTNEECMAWVHDEIGRSVGLPSAIGGIPLDTLGATGFGLSQAIDIAKDQCGMNLSAARIVIQGFGSVGQHAARFLTEKGATLVGVSDSHGAIAHPDGLNVAELIEIKKQGQSVVESGQSKVISADELLALECDIWIPAARPDVINESNMNSVKAKIIAQGANIPITAAAEKALHERGVICLPDFIANAGGVICAAMEYAGATQDQAFNAIAEKIRNNTQTVLERMAQDKITPRQAAEQLAKERVLAAMETRRFNLF